VFDFVGNLEASGYFKKSIEIVSTQTEAQATPNSPEVVRFLLKADFVGPGEPPPLPAPAGRGAAPGRGAPPPAGRK
jgi:hypothetical protein